MRSETLKQLVKDKVSLKFRIKDEQQSRELQNFFFAQGVGWFNGDNSIKGEDSKYIFIDNIYPYDRPYDYSISRLVAGDKNEKEFNTEPHKEFDLINDHLIEECKWPNLKKLVDAKTPLKFRVKDAKQSRKIQAFLFSLGVRWHHTEDTCHRKNFLYMFLGCFYSSPDEYKIAGCKSDSETCCFDNEKSTEYKEFDFENDCLVEPCKWPNLKKLVRAKVPLKFRIKDVQQSKELQDFLFDLDFSWPDGRKTPMYCEEKYIFIDYNYYRSPTLNYFYFYTHDVKKFDLTNDCLLENDCLVEKKELSMLVKEVIEEIILYENPTKKDLKEKAELAKTFLKYIEENL